MCDILDEELDASVEFGSGYISVVGPPGSGKTSLVLRYLVAREQTFASSTDPDWDGPTPPGSPPSRPHEPDAKERRCFVKYWTARSFGGEALAYMSHSLQAVADASSANGLNGRPRRRRRLVYDCTPLEFGHIVAHCLEAHAPGSELHLVIDDADALDAQGEAVNAWLSSCLNTEAVEGKKVCIWLLSQLPLRLSKCFRFHFVSALNVDAVCAWIQAEQRAHGHLLAQEELLAEQALCTDPTAAPVESGGAGSAPAPLHTYTLAADEASECVVKAVHYYATHQPMCASVTSKDVRLLLQKVYQLLPALVVLGGNAGSTSDEANASRGLKIHLNAIHYSAAWGRHKEAAADDASADALVAPTAHAVPSGFDDPLVIALKKIGLSAVLLAFAAFYCGAVPRRKQLEVFSADARTGGRAAVKADAHAQSHKAAVLSAASHVITLPWLLHTYEALLAMCIEHIDPLEFASSEVAAHYLYALQAWALVTPVVSQKNRKKYHCWIPVSTAVSLGKTLSLNLFDLIPT